VGIAFAARWLLTPVLHDRVPYGFFLVAVIITASIADIWESVFAMVLGFLAGTWFFANERPSIWVSDVDDRYAAGVYFITGLAIVWFVRSKEAARLRALMSEVELRKQQEALVQEKTRHGQTQGIREILADIVENAQDSIISITQEGRIATWNGAAERLFEFSAGQAIGQPLNMVVPSDRRTEMERILEKINRGARVEPWETVLRREDGSRVEVWVTISPVRDRAGKIIGASVIARRAPAPRKGDPEPLAESQKKEQAAG
jgi:PAS domain S-box-containing protein